MKIHDALRNILNHQYALYLKTQNYHWNIEGPNFLPLHELFESQYKSLSEFIDTTAEHIRSLGFKVTASFHSFLTECKIMHGNENFNSAEMLQDLIQSHTIVEELLKIAVLESARVDDFVVNDYLIECLTFHRKAIWMLTSNLKTH